MPIYEYRCYIVCGDIDIFQKISDEPLKDCPECGHPVRRVYGSIKMAPVMQEHFNHSVGKLISDPKQFDAELKRKSEEMTERTGMKHNYVAADMSDQTALKATDEGMDSTMSRKTKSGERESKKTFHG